MSLDLDPNHIFRDFVTDGIPASGKHDPRKVEIRQHLSSIWQAVIALLADANPGLALPNLLIRYTVTGGTADAIVATPNLAPPSGPGLALFSIQIAQENTGPVTINGKPLRTNSGNEIAIGGLVAGGIYLFLDEGSSFRLVSDQVSAAIVAAAEAAADRAEEAAGEVLSLIGGVTPVFATKAMAELYAPTVPPSFLQLVGYAAAGDGGAARYRRVPVEPDHAGKISITLDDGETVAWYEIAELKIYPEMFGVITPATRDPVTRRVIDIGDAAAIANRNAIQAAYDFVAANGGGAVNYMPGRIYTVDKDAADTYGLVFDKDNVWHIGPSALHRRYDRNDPWSLIRLGSFPETSLTNGRTNIIGGGLSKLEIDGGCNVQLVANGRAFDGTTGWDAIGGTLETIGGADQRRAFRLTKTDATARAFYEMSTIPGVAYYLLCEVGGGDSASWDVIASSTFAASGSLAQVSRPTQPDGRVRLEFTATGTSSFFIMNLSSGVAAGTFREFRDIRVWEKSDQDSAPIISASGLKRYHFQDLHVHDSRHYGIGLQNGGYEDCKISDCVIEDTYMDGLDHKNNGSVSKGNSISNLTLRRNGLKSEITNPAASLDLSEGWAVTGVSVHEFGASDGAGAGVRFKVGEATDSRGTGGRRTAASAIKVEADIQCLDTVAGIHFMNKFCALSDFSIVNVGRGILITDAQNKIANGHIDGVKAFGILIQDKAASPSFPLTEADRNKLMNITVRNAQVGVQIDGDLNELHGVEAVNNVLNLKNTGAGNRWYGGEISPISGPTTKQVENTHASLVIKDARSFATEVSIETQDVSVATVGSSSSFSTPHGLGYTPAPSDIDISIRRVTQASYAAIPVVVGATATDVVWRLDTVTASAGAVAKCNIHVNSRSVPAIA